MIVFLLRKKSGRSSFKGFIYICACVSACVRAHVCVGMCICHRGKENDLRKRWDLCSLGRMIQIIKRCLPHTHTHRNEAQIDKLSLILSRTHELSYKTITIYTHTHTHSGWLKWPSHLLCLHHRETVRLIRITNKTQKVHARTYACSHTRTHTLKLNPSVDRWREGVGEGEGDGKKSKTMTVEEGL